MTDRESLDRMLDDLEPVHLCRDCGDHEDHCRCDSEPADDPCALPSLMPHERARLGVSYRSPHDGGSW